MHEFFVGQKVICVNDSHFGPAIEFFATLPVKGRVYTISEVVTSKHWFTRQPKVSVTLEEIPRLQPRDGVFFTGDRFRPLEEETSDHAQDHEALLA
jgi:hypothetical protein